MAWGPSGRELVIEPIIGRLGHGGADFLIDRLPDPFVSAAERFGTAEKGSGAGDPERLIGPVLFGA